jgi:hypothetical protein
MTARTVPAERHAGIVDHTRNTRGMVNTRLLDLVPVRSGKAYADWLKDRGAGPTHGCPLRRIRSGHP